MNSIALNTKNEKPGKVESNATNSFKAIEAGDLNLLNKVLANENTQIWEYIDEEGSTCLLKSSFLDLTDISILLMDEVKRKIPKDSFILWLNKKGNNGFCAIHYASFRGNMKLLEKLIENGADITVRNNNGLNVMHMASQGDQPTSLVFFREYYDMKMNSLDCVLSTPLHWASYMGAEAAVDYLIAYKVDLNVKDKDGFTPLHLAVMTERERIAKKLIKVGANILAEDDKKRKPLDIAIQKNNTSLITVLSENANIQKCSLNNSQKAKDYNIYPFTFFTFFYIFEILGILFILPHLNSKIYLYYSITIFALVNFGYIQLFFSNPGFKRNKTVKTLKKLVKEGEKLNNICPVCITGTSTTTRHCYYCNKCVENFDHHCIWIKKCIAKNNYKNFLFFLFMLCIKLISNIYFSFESMDIFNLGFMYKNVLFQNSIFSKYKFLDFIFSQRLKNIIASVEIITGMIVFIPVFLLVLTHIQNIKKAKSSRFKPNFSMKESFLNGCELSDENQALIKNKI